MSNADYTLGYSAALAEVEWQRSHGTLETYLNSPEIKEFIETFWETGIWEESKL